MMTDTKADMVARIKNGILRKKEKIELPYSKMKENIANVLKEHEFINDVKVFKEKNSKHKSLSLILKYNENGESNISEIKIVSKPGLRIYRSHRDIKPLKNGLGIYIVSTSRGVMSDKEARIKKLGGEVICLVF